jgi:hypothetical protein
MRTFALTVVALVVVGLSCVIVRQWLGPPEPQPPLLWDALETTPT